MGLLNQSAFNFTTLIPSNSSKSPLPQAILVQVHILGKNLNFQLIQLSSKTSLIDPQVYQKSKLQRNNITWSVKPMSSKKIVCFLV